MRPTFARVAETIWPKLAAACLASILAVLATPTPGLAQGFLSFLWDEGGAREVVPFHPRHMPGQIIVSFGDRRLYWVHRRGEAISYPIAIPREKSRWAGVTRVSDKRVNPAWTPTAEMRREIRAYRFTCRVVIRKTLWASEPSISAPACIAFTEPTRPGPLARPHPRAAFDCTIATCSTFTRACLLERA